MKKTSIFSREILKFSISCAMLLGICILGSASATANSVSSEVLFHASFDKGFDADKAKGDPSAKMIGTVAKTEGIHGKAVVVGPKGWLEYLLEGNLNKAGGAGSIEMWVKPLDWDGSQSKEATFFYAEYDNEGKSVDQQGLFRLYNIGGASRLTFIGGPYPNNAPAKWVTVQSEVPNWKKGEWHHVVVTWDGFNIAVYVDGEQKQRAKIPAAHMRGGEDPRFIPYFGRLFTIGASPWSDAGETAIDEVNIYKSALLPEDVVQLFKLYAKTGVHADEASQPAGKSSSSNILSHPIDIKARASMSIPILSSKPAIDGIVDEKEWAGASSANGFVEVGVLDRYCLGRNDNRFYICIVEQTLYLGLVSDFKGNQPPSAEAASNSGKIFLDDCFEIHLSSPANKNQIYKYDINAKGSLDCYHVRPQAQLFPTQARAAAKILPGKWSCELAVPLKEIGVNLPIRMGDKLLFQIVRSYKDGTVAQRESASRSVETASAKEEYAGFPWNSSFWNIENYGELIFTDDLHAVKSNVDLTAYFKQNELKIQGILGSGWFQAVKTGQLKIYKSPSEAVTDQVPVQPDGHYVLAKALPNKSSEAVFTLGGALLIKLPLSRNSDKLTLNYTIFSYNNTLQAEMDISEMTAYSPADLRGEVSIKGKDGKILEKEKISSFARCEERRTLSIASLAAGKYTLECKLQDCSGNPAASASQTFEVFRKLPGEGNQLGITDEAPAPWTPVEIGQDNQIKVWGRTYDFGKSILPQQVLALGKPILSAPITYEVQLAGAPASLIHEGSLKVIEQKPGKVILEGDCRSPDVEIKQRLTIEFDGMIRCDADVTAKKPIQRLSLKIPYLKDRAKWFFPVNGSSKFTDVAMDPLEINPAFKWSSLYLYPCIWVTDMRAGLSWFAGSDRTWVVDRKRNKLEVNQNGMTVNFIDTESASTRNIKFTYGLQAFPTRPARPDWREFGRVREGKWVYYHTPDMNGEQQSGDGLVPEKYFRELMQGANYRLGRALLIPFGDFPRSVESYTALPPDVYEFSVKKLHQFLKSSKESGLEYICPYMTPTYSTESIPEWKFYWSNWIGIPKARFDADGETKVCVTNVQWRDFWLQSLHDYLKKHQIKGIFHDMALPYAEEGALNGLGYDKDGVRYPEFPVWELRETLKRAYILHRKLIPDAMSFMNEGLNFVPPIHSFADFLYNCERYETRADRSVYEFDGDGNMNSISLQLALPRGPQAMAGGWLKYQIAFNEKGPTIHWYGIVLLHDVIQMNICENPEVRSGAHALKKRIGIGYDRGVEFLPYWDFQDKYRVESKDILISFYRKDSKLLAIIVNKSMKNTFQGTVELDTRKLGINSIQTVEIFDPLNNSYQPLKEKTSSDKLSLKLEIKPTLYKAVLVNVP